MIEQLIARINELSRKHKATGLTHEELVERDELRKKYLANFKSNFRQQLDSIKYTDEDDSVKH
ncbi:DUF896 domain-containing protein [Paenibacillus sp. GCM10023252]|uniref:DUF896 domain-containing protein n=1 Tax=Paenibacillus sp. GCM10023252 TaxID=3252649 RepID=UPI00361E2B2B